MDSNSTQSLELRTSTTTSTLTFASLRQRRRRLADSKHASNYLTKRSLSKSKYSIFQLIQVKNEWRIDDIVYTKDNASLKAAITAILDEAVHLKE